MLVRCIRLCQCVHSSEFFYQIAQVFVRVHVVAQRSFATKEYITENPLRLRAQHVNKRLLEQVACMLLRYLVDCFFGCRLSDATKNCARDHFLYRLILSLLNKKRTFKFRMKILLYHSSNCT